jgi:hypothetical protein
VSQKGQTIAFAIEKKKGFNNLWLLGMLIHNATSCKKEHKKKGIKLLRTNHVHLYIYLSVGVCKYTGLIGFKLLNFELFGLVFRLKFLTNLIFVFLVRFMFF